MESYCQRTHPCRADQHRASDLHWFIALGRFRVSKRGHIVLDPQPRPAWQVMTSHPGTCSPLAIRPRGRLATWPIAKSPRWPMRQRVVCATL